jgi:hypothetical protein
VQQRPETRANRNACFVAGRAPCGSKATVAAYSTQALLRELKSEPDVYKVQRWLQLGANANARDEDGGTVLDRAAMSVDSDILQLVIDYGAAVNHKIRHMVTRR